MINTKGTEAVVELGVEFITKLNKDIASSTTREAVYMRFIYALENVDFNPNLLRNIDSSYDTLLDLKRGVS